MIVDAVHTNLADGLCGLQPIELVDKCIPRFANALPPNAFRFSDASAGLGVMRLLFCTGFAQQSIALCGNDTATSPAPAPSAAL